jgi:MFS-type transporter involved in bile tolerance (Atg22 family)
MKGFPPLINALLVSSLVLTIGRGVTLPFITIYLTGHFHLLPKSVGIILGISLAIGIFASLYGGYLVDKFNKNTLILISILLFALSFSLSRGSRGRGDRCGFGYFTYRLFRIGHHH